MPHDSNTPTRLLNAKSRLLETFPSSCPPYAIVSHTWGTEEISHAEWLLPATHRDKRQASKAGYRKIISACSQTLADGLKYVWVDTCCIDRRNNNELCEAINLMFSWYGNAAVCYALLSDVEHGTQLFPAEQQIQSRERLKISADWSRKTQRGVAAVRSSRWFTRGWTLQETIAPHTVHFFDSKWIWLGALRQPSILALVADITGIDPALLAGRKALTDYSIAQRLSWAAKRQTTKPEDLAYSLLGIVGVNMILLYGEGPQAFTRLQELILESSEDLSVLAWTHSISSARSQLLAPSPLDFQHCGRIAINIPGSQATMTEHWRTSRGLKGTFEVGEADLSDSPSPCKLILLGLHPVRAPGQVIALPVKALNSAASSPIFKIDPMLAAQASSMIERLTTLDRRQLRNVSLLDCTILLG
ncbi:hypothetical protein LTR78_006511 [Recurvomyces mirabilis]|uniref:Heterokaryon incompatibility domain-containing protein n=1 Tax=Recurvomyces mirabilis TaxID=574656 RepID=A0AAE0WKW3_9PEZI|nr:hypothetical protein LTR78_006511 [Recurvomyces mirabilis]KAK5151071.1 hypothetical protein LTS14_009566 [Recurvomyces mirabilis]